MDVITLKQGERRELDRWVRGQSRDAAQARWARLILLLADGAALLPSVWPDCTRAMPAERQVRGANDRRRAFLNGRPRESQPMAPLIGAVASCRWNWAMSRTECCAGVGQTRYQTASLERYM